jgi:carboxypeptidase family protein
LTPKRHQNRSQTDLVAVSQRQGRHQPLASQVRPVLAPEIVPTAAYAQASIAGVVRDTSGAVLSKVSVEAASPELIEKGRTVVTDGTGRYRIVDLRPGFYTVTFTLTDFNRVRHEGIELTGSLTGRLTRT